MVSQEVMINLVSLSYLQDLADLLLHDYHSVVVLDLELN